MAFALVETELVPTDENICRRCSISPCKGCEFTIQIARGTATTSPHRLREAWKAAPRNLASLPPSFISTVRRLPIESTYSERQKHAAAMLLDSEGITFGARR